MPFTLRSLFTCSTARLEKHGESPPAVSYHGYLVRHWPDDEQRRIVTQYQINTHMHNHWAQMLRRPHDKLEEYRERGYLEPITLAAVQAQTFAQR